MFQVIKIRAFFSDLLTYLADFLDFSNFSKLFLKCVSEQGLNVIQVV